MAVDGEPLFRHDERAAGTVERIVVVTAITESLVLHPAPAVVEGVVGELDDVIRVSDLDRAGSIVSNTTR